AAGNTAPTAARANASIHIRSCESSRDTPWCAFRTSGRCRRGGSTSDLRSIRSTSLHAQWGKAIGYGEMLTRWPFLSNGEI
ncbi:hypothetical protein, partial [Streptomyces aureus]|uniref:hypothetical protein n=1 Tax=Streptomyces aureus TaxID=193461 RepID=UPI0031D3D1E4